VTTKLAGATCFSLVERDLQRVRAALQKVATDFQASARMLLEHAAPDRGKLLRPTLLLLSGRLFGAITAEHIRAATTLELVHNATLLHDDVLDQGGVRRGRPTVNRRWGNLAAVRLGDVLLSKVLELSAGLRPEVQVLLGGMMRRTCAGEIRQTAHAGDFFLTEREYRAIVAWKTAALFEGACYLGARLTDASIGACRTAARFGYNTGLAYQIADDLLDIVGDGRSLRKTLGTDLRKAKPTLPLIHALQVLPEPRRTSVRSALAARRLARSELRDVLAASGSVDYVLTRIGRHADRAKETLREVPQTPVKMALLEIPGVILQEAVGQAAKGMERSMSLGRVAAQG
jgi:octaprenyl-diphosphate synthase